MTSSISARFLSVKEILVIQPMLALKVDTSVAVKLHENVKFEKKRF